MLFRSSNVSLSAPVELVLSTRPGPDLGVSNLALTSATGTLESGALLTVTWNTGNNGTEPATGPWQERVIVRRRSDNQQLASVLVDVPADTTLAAGASLSRSAQLRLPEGSTGAGDLVVQVVTDVTNAVAEQGAGGQAENNNSAALNFTAALALYPDLVTSNLVVEPASGWAPGSTVTVRWRVTNTGLKDVTDSWSDGIQVRNLLNGAVVYSSVAPDALGGATSLAPGAFVERSATITWPLNDNGIGRFEFTVSADSATRVTEGNGDGTGESNNSAQLTVVSAPDLRVANLATIPTTTTVPMTSTT